MKKNTLNEQQQAVVDCNDKYIVCSAAAGSGKTHTMIERIYRLVNKDHVNPTSILALTFTNAAALEMKTRYRNRDTKSSSLPEFRTFHGFCYSLLCNDIQVLTAMGYKKPPTIADDSELKKLRKSIKHSTGIKLSDNKLNEDDSKLTPKEEYEKKRYFSLVRKQMQTDNIISFDDLCKGICDLFIKNDKSILKYKKKYQYIFIDEFQDTDPIQWQFAKSFKDSNIFVCGDISQGIYSFRNADSSIMKRLVDDKDWTVLNLTHNYRSTKNIVNYANEIVSETPYGLTMETDKDGPYVIINEFSEKNRNYKHIDDMSRGKLLDWIADYKRNPYDGTVALLDRTNARVDNLKEILTENGLEYSEVNTDEDIPYILNSLSDNEYLINWVSSYLNDAEYIRYLNMENLGYDNTDDSHIQKFYKHFGCKYDRIKYRMDTVFQLRLILSDAKKSWGEKYIEACKLLGIKIIPSNNVTIMSVQDLVDYISKTYNTAKTTSIYVGTIHSVKGLEFDQVLLFSVNDVGFDLEKDDNLNLFYVGVTRAKTDLTVFYHTRNHGRYDDY